MKKLICMLLAFVLVFCGCARQDTGAAPSDEAAQSGSEVSQNVDATEVDPPEVTLHTGEGQSQGQGVQQFQVAGATGAERIEYKQNASSVRYITRVEDLPDYEALDGYRNAEYFETQALLVVVDTVTSGSVKVSIGFLGDGTVTLAKEMSGTLGTADMATWLLWAEVDQGLTDTWTVTNPGVQNNLSTY